MTSISSVSSVNRAGVNVAGDAVQKAQQSDDAKRAVHHHGHGHGHRPAAPPPPDTTTAQGNQSVSALDVTV